MHTHRYVHIYTHIYIIVIVTHAGEFVIQPGQHIFSEKILSPGVQRFGGLSPVSGCSWWSGGQA